MKIFFLSMAIIGSLATANASTYLCKSDTESNFKYGISFDEGFMIVDKYNSDNEVVFDLIKLWNQPSPKCYEVGRRDVDTQRSKDVTLIATFCLQDNSKTLTITTRSKPLPWEAKEYRCEEP